MRADCFCVARLLLSACLLLPQVSSWADDGADIPGEGNTQVVVAQLLERMVSAARTLDYRGSLTYEYGSALATLKLAHSVQGGVEYESLEHLNGAPMEVVRAGRKLDCGALDDHVLMGHLQRLADNRQGLARFYHFNLAGSERIAGRDALLLDIIPRDAFRYGYQLAIDRRTGLLLKSLLLGRNKQILERFQFVEVAIGAAANTLSEVQAAETSAQGRVRFDYSQQVCDAEPVIDPLNWRVSWLPAGFALTSSRRRPLETGWRDLLQYTDGLSSFSVFIETVGAGAALQGNAQRGGTVVYMSQLADGVRQYRVTVVGEVPIQTAQRVAASLQPQLSLSDVHGAADAD